MPQPLRLLIWTGGPDEALEAAVAAVGGVAVRRARDRAAAIGALTEVDALISADHAWSTDLAEALHRAPSVRWVQLVTAGFDRLERLGLPRRVTVSTIGGSGASTVAEHALCLLLGLLRQAPAALDAQRRREWAFAALTARIQGLRGMELAVLGFGHIGRAVAGLARAFGARVTGIARSARVEADGCEVVARDRMEAVLKRSDALVITAPLNADTESLVNADLLATIKRGAWLVNVSRGRIVVTEALVAALEEGALAGAALDVTDPEPLPAEHPLWTMSNVIITPHVAWAGGGPERGRALQEAVTDNVRRFVAGQPLRNVAAVEHSTEHPTEHPTEHR